MIVRKGLVICAALCLVFAAVGCGDDTEAEDGNGSSESSTSSTGDNEAASGTTDETSSTSSETEDGTSFERADDDDDGAVTLDEWSAAGGDADTFNDADDNDDGTVDADEFNAAVPSSGFADNADGTDDETDITDEEPTDPCDPNPCTSAPSAVCASDTSVQSYAAEGTCTTEGTSFSCDYTTNATTADCGDAESCINGVCAAAGDPTEYQFSDTASWVTSLAIAEGNDCCFDYDMDGTPDNGLGGLLGSLGTFLAGSLPEGGVSSLIQEQIDSAELAIIFEQVGLDDDTDDDAVTVNGFFAKPSVELAEGELYTEDADYSTGSGGFIIDPESFIPETVQPVISFDGSVIGSGIITTNPALFLVSIPLADLGFTLDLSIEQAQLEAEVSYGGNGIGLDWMNGKLGGVVDMGQFVAALNMLASTCPCLGLLEGEGMLELAEGQEDKMKCTAPFSAASPNCGADDGDLCSGISDNKSLVCTAIGILKPDIDTNFNGEKDSFSIGMIFTGVSANIDGLFPTEDDGSEDDGSEDDGSGDSGSGDDSGSE
jgi:hypothetical protein